MFPFILLALVSTVLGAPRNDLDGRIVGGRSATIEEFPYQVSLLYYNYPTCGGTIIAPKFVITAAHCTDRIRAPALAIRAGSNTTSENGQEINVAEVYQHPSFSMDTMDFDISILLLSTSIKFGPSTAPIKLAAEDFIVAPGTKVIVTGWGTLTPDGQVPRELQVVEIPAVSNEECREAYKNMTDITDRMICAREKSGGKDSCQGDSGGPLVVDGVLAGVVSWGFSCALPEYPGVYSRISEFRSFIKNVTNI